MHYLDANKTAGEKARRQLHKNAANNIEQALEQHPTKHQLYGHLPPITKTIQVRWTTHAGHCWRSRDELISDVLLWTPIYGRAKAGRPARTYIQQLCEDVGCSPEDLPKAMNDREKGRERVRDIRAGGTTWWWWYIYMGRNFWILIILLIKFGMMLTVVGEWYLVWTEYYRKCLVWFLLFNGISTFEGYLMPKPSL